MSMICARLAVVSAVWKTLRALRALPLVLTAAALLLSAAGAGDAAAQATAQAAEHEVKAAFLYKFISYIEWPPRSFAREDSPLVIGVVDAPAVADELASIVAGRNVNGRGVILRKVERGEALAGVHVLFVGRGTGARAATLLAAARGHAMLTVTESDETFPTGSVINFVVIDGKVRFDVDARHAESENIKVSARLLSVARKVVTNPS